jgi:hypothetical protein
MKLLLAMVVLALGCGSKKPPNKELKECPKRDGRACNFLNCGGNSALLNAFPVNGVRPDGECNEDGVQLVPESMEGAKCDGMTLDIDGKKLVGRKGANTCDVLAGVSFAVRSYKGVERIAITNVTEVPAANGDKYAGYRMEWTKETETETPGGKRKQLCAKEGRKLRIALGINPMAFSDDIPDDADLVIPVVSELYNEEGKAIDPPNSGWSDQKLEWNHLACVADALAKRTLHGQLTSDKARSRAVLRMWTADYCGGRPFTVRGKLIDFNNTAGLETESQWDENGATCLNKPRIVMDKGVEVVPSNPTRLLKAFCPTCTTAADWIKEAATCTESSRPTHQLGPCVACTTNCPLESRHPK